MTEIVALGAGRMGRGIAQVFAYAGHPVTILDFKDRTAADADALLKEAVDEVAENLNFLKDLNVVDDRGIARTLGNVHVATNDAAAELLSAAAYVFEGAPETPDAKRDSIGRASALSGPDTVIASTSSTMLADVLGEYSSRPENFLNAHFLNPAYLIPLVEVSPSEKTDPTVEARFTKLLEDIGKVPVRCVGSPGYIVSRLQAGAMNEAARMVEEGVASAEDIDRAVRTGFGVRYATMGFVEFIDWGGVDILYHASRYLKTVLGDRFSSPDIVSEMMERGDLGLKTGKGFYDFGDIDPDAYRREKLSTFVELLKHLDLMPKAGR